MWTLMIAGLVFLILASAANLFRTQAALARERERAAAAEALRAKAELAALRARVDPHFLFNTLHSVLALVRQDPFRAEEAIEQFADILRYTFAAGDGSEERTLRQEWELVENYLSLERLRLGARLRVRERLDENVAATPLPVLTLQPLVENAIRHAIAPRAGGGCLEILATRCDQGVRIDVSDDGPGVEPEALASNHGRGLHLVRERLARLYGSQATMELGSSEQGGLRVTLVIPKRE
jgi:sensor histidine kinase YesM